VNNELTQALHKNKNPQLTTIVDKLSVGLYISQAKASIEYKRSWYMELLDGDLIGYLTSLLDCEGMTALSSVSRGMRSAVTTTGNGRHVRITEIGYNLEKDTMRPVTPTLLLNMRAGWPLIKSVSCRCWGCEAPGPLTPSDPHPLMNLHELDISYCKLAVGSSYADILPMCGSTLVWLRVCRNEGSKLFLGKTVLASCPNLEHLWIIGDHVTEMSLISISKCPKLKTFELTQQCVGRDPAVDLTIFDECYTLETFILRDSAVDLLSVPALSCWKNLQTLILQDVTVTNPLLYRDDQNNPFPTRVLSKVIASAIAQCRKLREVWLDGFLDMEDGALECLAAGSQTIRAIRIDIITSPDYRHYNRRLLLAEVWNSGYWDRAVDLAFSGWRQTIIATGEETTDFFSRLLVRHEATVKSGLCHINAEPRIRAIW